MTVQADSDRVAASIIACRAKIIQCRGLGPDNFRDPVSEGQLARGIPAWQVHKDENDRINRALYNLATQRLRSHERIELDNMWHRIHARAEDKDAVLAIEDAEEAWYK